jgi:hypothetical protein
MLASHAVEMKNVQVERMIAQQELKHQPRVGSGGVATASSNNSSNPSSSKHPTVESAAPEAGSNGSNAAQAACDAGTAAANDCRSAPQKMSRDKIISKFSKKKPAYSSCRMISQVSNCDRAGVSCFVQVRKGWNTVSFDIFSFSPRAALYENACV